jgi:peptidoglycan/xylan/chitin deacetylase (PgdA/CDA1 family)
MSTTIPVVWSNDDICHGQADILRRQLELLDRFKIPGVFFVIPASGDKSLDKDLELVRIMRDAEQHGHEFYQHGFLHTPFESGVPELWMLDFNPAVRARYDRERFEIEAGHTFESMVRMINAGRRVWRKAMGSDPAGYRPGWGAYCANLYRALNTLGFSWVSSRLCAPTSWMWNQGKWDVPMSFVEHIPTSPHLIEGIREFPMCGDYAFRVPNDPKRIGAMADLAMADFEMMAQRGDPMVIVSHHHGLSFKGDTGGVAPHPGGTGYAVHEQLLLRMLEDGRARFVGMKDLLRDHEPADRLEEMERPIG